MRNGSTKISFSYGKSNCLAKGKLTKCSISIRVVNKNSFHSTLFFDRTSNRLEKALLQPVTRTSTGKLPLTRSNAETPIQNRTNAVAKGGSPSTLVNSKQVSIGHKATAEEIKEKMEQELRAQRAEHHKKRTLEMMQQKKGECSIFKSLKNTAQTHS